MYRFNVKWQDITMTEIICAVTITSCAFTAVTSMQTVTKFFSNSIL